VNGRVLAVGVLLFATGCTSSPPEAAPSDSPIPPVATSAPPAPLVGVRTLDCGAPIATSARPDRGMSVALGSVALQNSRFQVRAEAGVPGGHVGKTGLQVRIGREVTIRSVGSPRAAFNWGNRGQDDFGRVFRVPACHAPDAARHSRWLTYPGLIATDGRGCLHLRISSGDRQQTLWIGAGAACP